MSAPVKVTNAKNAQRRITRRSRPVALSLFVLAAVTSIGGCLLWPAQAQIAVQNQGYVPYSDEPILYRARPLTDAVAQLQKRLDEGKAQLAYDDSGGYLKSTLALLNIPASSQTLVFSKTSFQHEKISPQHPRALYYNDDVYVGAVHRGKALEIISFDPMQGAIFYVLDDHKVDKPQFQRAELDCTQCHIAPGTRGIPGVFLQSVYATSTGSLAPRAPFYITDQKSPVKERWGGWYVSGPLAANSLANAAVAAPLSPGEDRTTLASLDLTPLGQPSEPGRYLAPGSDAVALLVLAHQTQMHNLITLTNYQTRIALHALEKAGQGVTDNSSENPIAAFNALPEKQKHQIKTPAEQLLRYMLFVKESPLGGADGQKIIAASDFAQDFEKLGVQDLQKRSLRDFDLRDRIFRYPCSYLIYSTHFDALPEPAKGYMYHRLLQVLSGQDRDPDFAHLSADDRLAILSILLETKHGLPDEWQDYAHTSKLRVAAPGTGGNR